ncbi:Protein of unknown function [Pyronema omphalodes CBS 100304]|uniref:Uncharacterized protein n=1 Tax=Pyronema omphalodes (strain CBS 100304) TaxID=1076935 RepID=U4LFT6_PYROM|nr:Protein of unknown function [Pyronema omphalodes CBS 100304]
MEDGYEMRKRQHVQSGAASVVDSPRDQTLYRLPGTMWDLWAIVHSRWIFAYITR